MALTPEQFAKITTKDEFIELKTDIKNMDEKIDRLLNSVEGIATKHKNFELEMTSNQVAHDRFEERIKGLEEKQGATKFA